MHRSLSLLLAVAFLTGCAGFNSYSPRTKEEKYIDLPSRDDSEPQTFALPGVPLEYMPRHGADLPEPAPAPAAASAKAAAAKPAETKPAQASWQLPPPSVPAAKSAAEHRQPAAAASEKDLQFHISAAKRYAAKKYHKSAAAEYGAALLFLPATDGRVVHLQERQAAMLLRAGDKAKAELIFAAAIQKAKELNVSNEDLANAHLGLAYCLELKKDIPGAITHYQKTLELSKVKMIRDRVAKTLSILKGEKK